ncbi:MAG: hypothetical protein FWF10_00525 [Clostridiales bacterium]|nr:hypothetical protein [Clostridiales bacterium]
MKGNLKIIYQSHNYDPAAITNWYLHIDLSTGLPVVNETVKTAKTNNTYRSYYLPESEWTRHAGAIAKAQKLKGHFPYQIAIKGVFGNEH